MVELEDDSIKTKNPRKAALYSTIFPGLGQIYNEKYWKLPIIYGGFAALTYSTQFNWRQYQEFKTAYLYKIDGNPNTVDPYPNVTGQAVQAQYQAYRKNFELSLIGFLVLYSLNIIDATVDAHLFAFDVSDNLSMHWNPKIEMLPASNSSSAQLAIHLKFK